ncbi:SgcJ/EcaC family oxidoreductase [Actinomadura decatromicini]|uniref:SgcJ/EcaC family oxidoreductase n=1 Tax=Actinomadura decatromicini TaxID=2604572 RepID=A0A5D3FRI6_9ACTN|nr:SgcJ/EcaC family oxidoreductase [Actinomadura decatromicini]TYK50546.1 SgcJ/EcaC family oxidoreductase [Actinomadura decatromicini]
MNSTESEVRAMFDQMYKAWADGDAAAFADHYTDDATVVMPGVFHQGRQAVRDYMAAGFAGPLKGSRAVDEPQDVRVHGDTAVIVSRAGILMAGETEVPAEGERLATWVVSKRDGRWLVSAYANAPAH